MVQSVTWPDWDCPPVRPTFFSIIRFPKKANKMFVWGVDKLNHL